MNRKQIGGGALTAVAAVAAIMAPFTFSSFTPVQLNLIWAGLGVIGLVGLFMVFSHKEKLKNTSLETNVATGDDLSIKTGDISGSGNRVGHDFYKPIPREIDAAFAESLTSKIPAGSSVEVTFDATDADSGVFAQKVQNFLRGRGYEMQMMSAVMTPLPDPGVIVNPNTVPVSVWVGRTA